MGYSRANASPARRLRRGHRNHVGHVRIIAGEWRGRKVSVASRPQLRPTPSRLRETLFNWIGDSIQDRRVLDLYAGSGILGLESLSRGAAHATFVENDRRTVTKLREACQRFELLASQAVVIDSHAGRWLEHNRSQWDLIFIDPPFAATKSYQNVLRMVASHLSERGMVYVESAVRSEPVTCDLETWKTKEIGEVRIQLFRPPQGENP